MIIAMDFVLETKRGNCWRKVSKRDEKGGDTYFYERLTWKHGDRLG